MTTFRAAEIHKCERHNKRHNKKKRTDAQANHGDFPPGGKMEKDIKKEMKRLCSSKDARLKSNASGAGYKKKEERKRKGKRGERTDYFPRGGKDKKKSRYSSCESTRP